ncbi:hypothetical protein L1049_006224 [Liquidambar formosana]|uniref:ABC-type xenobiotic transporter n=1 Tax=Liquidambar formosana TaxID=63359 RepID=A0AAP0RH06_LIQFO
MQVFAGVNTIASYTGPFLITNFMNFLSGKNDDSSYLYGLILAFIFFSAKTVESLSQRQWYFGAQRIGIRIRAALMVLIYQKSLSIKYAGPSNGKITNIINVDVERMGDFCWYIHGIWLLPVQVFLALVILYRNLGIGPSYCSSVCHSCGDGGQHPTSQHARKPTLVSVITFGVCIVLGTPLTSGTVLSALATFRILQEPIYNLPELISMIAQTKVSVDRIQEFIREEGQKKMIPFHTFKSSSVAVEIETGEYAWETNDQNLKKPTIKIAEKMKIMKGYKVAVCGSVGSGKSSLLCSILGEIPRVSGAGIKVYGSKAYVPQSAWIQTGTVRENVLFGKEMKKGFYEDVLEGCALNRDIEMLVDGDLNVVGERGINLSGGQKQRIQLARAVYSDSDVYFLDDPFSAVDAHTGAHLFKASNMFLSFILFECLMHLLARKTVFYVTHQLEFLDASDLVLVMKDGRIVQSGKYEDLAADPNGELVRQMNAHRKSLDQVNPPQEDNTLTSTTHQKNQVEVTEEDFEEPVGNGKLSKRAHEEESETGRVKWHVYSTFVTSAYKGALVPIVLLCQIFFQGLQIGSNYWIAWATEEESRASREQLMGIFALMSGGSSIFMLGRAVFLSTIAIKTAQHLFSGMITSVFRAPISFFDSTPSSRILNRSSKDQSIVDTDIPYRLAGLAFALILLFSIIILMSQVAWQVFPLFLAILAISIWYQAYYITTARELARMVGIRKAPILHHFSESITGTGGYLWFESKCSPGLGDMEPMQR